MDPLRSERARIWNDPPPANGSDIFDDICTLTQGTSAHGSTTAIPPAICPGSLSEIEINVDGVARAARAQQWAD
jgi:hypothetical protein